MLAKTLLSFATLINLYITVTYAIFSSNHSSSFRYHLNIITIFAINLRLVPLPCTSLESSITASVYIDSYYPVTRLMY